MVYEFRKAVFTGPGAGEGLWKLGAGTYAQAGVLWMIPKENLLCYQCNCLTDLLRTFYWCQDWRRRHRCYNRKRRRRLPTTRRVTLWVAGSWNTPIHYSKSPLYLEARLSVMHSCFRKNSTSTHRNRFVFLFQCFVQISNKHHAVLFIP